MTRLTAAGSGMLKDKKSAPALRPEHAFSTIDKTTFDRLLDYYEDPFGPDEGEGESLDEVRYSIIPNALNGRTADPHLRKEEVVSLVEWKLKHGTFRPTLKALVQQNDAKQVESTTRKGFAEFSGDQSTDALKTLTALRGIGPATASLLLSVYDPDNAPFFSDELFRWAFFEAGRGNGWDRRIKYSAKEYTELCGRVAQLDARLGVRAVEAEKVAFVLGNDGALGDTADEAVALSTKRKVEEMEDAGRPSPGGTSAATGTNTRLKAVKTENERRDKLSSEEKNETNASGRPRRGTRK